MNNPVDGGRSIQDLLERRVVVQADPRIVAGVANGTACQASLR